MKPSTLRKVQATWLSLFTAGVLVSVAALSWPTTVEAEVEPSEPKVELEWETLPQPTFEEETEILESETTEYIDFADEQPYYVRATKLYVRSTPDATVEDSIVSELNYGEAIAAVPYNNNWMVARYDGTIVYVASKYLADEPNPDPMPIMKTAIGSRKKVGRGVLSKASGRVAGPSGTETYYNLNMNYCVKRMQSQGYAGEYWVRDDGVKMFGDYVMVAADFSTRPIGTTLETSLGTAIVVDTGEFAASDPTAIDVAVAW